MKKTIFTLTHLLFLYANSLFSQYGQTLPLSKDSENYPYLQSRYKIPTSISNNALNKPYFVSKPKSDKLELFKIYKFIAQIEKEKKSNPNEPFHTIDNLGKPLTGNLKVIKRINGKEFIVYRMNLINRGSTNTWQINYTQKFYLKTLNEINVVDNETIKEITYNIKDEIYNYQLSKIRTLQQVKSNSKEGNANTPSDFPWFTKKEFVNRLKSGETWTISLYDKVKCVKCYGKGATTFGNGSNCSACNATGYRYINLTVRW